METITIVLLAFLVERITEIIFGQPFDMIEALKPWKPALRYIALVLGVVVCVGYQVDMLAMLGLPEMPMGMYITGLVVGGGSQVVHDVFGLVGK